MKPSELLSTPSELHQELAVTPSQRVFIENSRQTIKNILDGKDPRLLLIVGPCSIHDIKAAKEYAIKLKALADQISSNFFIAMRAHFEKPRTTLGWKGMLYDPHLDGSHDVLLGLRRSRQCLLELAELGLPAATEFLDLLSPDYLGDLVSWGSIGARTTASQPHRQLASGLSMPLGFKNGTDGDIPIAVHAIIAASAPHIHLGMDFQGRAAIKRTLGNRNTHLVLRGGDQQTNYDPASIYQALQLLEKANLPQRLLVDCSHDNSRKNPENQPSVFQSAIHQFLEGNQAIRGMILESYLIGGNQSIPSAQEKNRRAIHQEISVTDPCMDWETTMRLIEWADATLNQNRTSIPSLHLV